MLVCAYVLIKCEHLQLFQQIENPAVQRIPHSFFYQTIAKPLEERESLPDSLKTALV